MRNFEPHIYSYTERSSGIKVVKAVTTYNGKAVYATAKCDPEDNFDFELGKKIALKRLEIKIAQKRVIDKLAYVKLCKMDLTFIEEEKQRIKKSMESAEIAAADRRVEVRQLETELNELLGTTN